MRVWTNFRSAATRPASGNGVSWLDWLLVLAGHTLLLLALYTVLYSVGILDYAPTSQRLINWDAGWFASVRDHGYKANATPALGVQSNIPFFPLLPYLWRLVGQGGTWISIVNYGLLLLGAAWMGNTFSLRRRQVLLLLSVPPLFFGMVPYAEALFFVFGAILLCGLHRQHLGLTLLGLLGCCLSRSAGTLFLPSFIIAELIAFTSGKELPRLLLRLVAGVLAMALALGLVMLLHYQATGDPFVLFGAYAGWGHLPTWPPPARVESWGGLIMLGTDTFALYTGILALAACFGIGWRWLLGWRRAGTAPTAPSRAVVFSLCYVVGAVLLVVLSGKGDLSNSSRYVLATPFFWVLYAQLARWSTLPRARRWQMLALAGTLALGVGLWLGWPLGLPGFFPAQATGLFGIWLAYVGAYMLVTPGVWRYGREVWGVLYALNLVYQVFLLNLFLNNIWLG